MADEIYLGGVRFERLPDGSLRITAGEQKLGSSAAVYVSVRCSPDSVGKLVEWLTVKDAEAVDEVNDPPVGGIGAHTAQYAIPISSLSIRKKRITGSNVHKVMEAWSADLHASTKSLLLGTAKDPRGSVAFTMAGAALAKDVRVAALSTLPISTSVSFGPSPPVTAIAKAATIDLEFSFSSQLRLRLHVADDKLFGAAVVRADGSALTVAEVQREIMAENTRHGKG